MGNGLHCCKINPEMVSLSNLFRNVSTTSLNRFKEISKSASSQQTLWVGKYHITFAPPTHFLEAANSFDSVVVRHIRPPAVFLKPLSSFFSDSMVPFHIVPKNALTFSDGDGGTLNQEMASLSIVMQISFVLLIFLLFSDQISGGHLLWKKTSWHLQCSIRSLYFFQTMGSGCSRVAHPCHLIMAS